MTVVNISIYLKGVPKRGFGYRAHFEDHLISHKKESKLKSTFCGQPVITIPFPCSQCWRSCHSQGRRRGTRELWGSVKLGTSLPQTSDLTSDR